MAKEIIGTVTCPHCGNNATVHEQARGRKLYYRCYEGFGSAVPVCGTVQILGPKGQEWIRANLKPIDHTPEPKPEPQKDPIGSETPQKQPDNPKGSKSTSFLASFWRDEDE